VGEDSYSPAASPLVHPVGIERDPPGPVGITAALRPNGSRRKQDLREHDGTNSPIGSAPIILRKVVPSQPVCFGMDVLPISSVALILSD
jgi:hypothetical protein